MSAKKMLLQAGLFLVGKFVNALVTVLMFALVLNLYVQFANQYEFNLPIFKIRANYDLVVCRINGDECVGVKASSTKIPTKR